MKTGVWNIDGRGRPSEDRSFIQDISGEFLIAGVLDGHSGSFTVDFTLKMLPPKLVELVRSVGNNEQGLRSGLKNLFIEHDKYIAQQGAIHYRDSGSTATIVIVTATQCYFAYIGDSPAFIYDPDTGNIITAIGKHEPTHPDEYKRIVKNGGSVTTDEGDAPRVNGCLMVSRAFGDFSMKFENSRIPEWTKNWATEFCVVADPEIVVIPRPQKGIIVLSSDGLVETPSGEFRQNSEVSKTIHDTIQKTGGDLKKSAQLVIQKQVSEFTDNPSEYDGDDITIVIIDITKAPASTGGAIHKPTTRKVKPRGRPRTGKKKTSQLPKTFMI